MTDQKDSAATPEQVPAQAPHSAEAGQPHSGGLSVEDFVRFLDDPAVNEVLARRFQSEKDRGVNQAKSVAQEAKDDVTRLAQALGIDPKKIADARNQLDMEDMLTQFRSGQLAPRVPDQKPLGSGPDLAKARSDILNTAGLTEAPTGFDDFMAAQDWSNPIAATLKVSAWVADKKAQQRPQTAADTAPPPGGLPATSLSHLSSDELGAKLSEYQRDPKAHAKERAEVLAELKRRRS